MTVTYEEYEIERINFIKKNSEHEWEVKMSPMDEYGRYSKTYIFDNGAQWFETCGPVTEIAQFEHRGMTFEAEVKMFRVEFFSTDDSKSKYYYERF